MTKKTCKLGYAVPSGITYIDGSDINGLPSAVIKDRKILTWDGIVAVVVGIDVKNNELINKPRIVAKGFVCQKRNDLIKKCEKEVELALLKLLATKPTFNELKHTMKLVTSSIISKEINRSPMVTPLIMTKN